MVVSSSPRLVAVLVGAATAMCAAVAPGSDATASGPVVALSHPALVIATTPQVQTLQADIVARPGAGTPMLVLGTARFTITVKNTSPVDLTHVTVTDRLSPRCNRAIGTLAPGAATTYVCSRPNVGRSYTNTATASGQWPEGVHVLAGPQATAKATAVVKARPKTKHRRVRVPHFALAKEQAHPLSLTG